MQLVRNKTPGIISGLRSATRTNCEERFPMALQRAKSSKSFKVTHRRKFGKREREREHPTEKENQPGWRSRVRARATRDPISSCRPFVRFVLALVASGATRRAFPGSPMLSALYTSAGRGNWISARAGRNFLFFRAPPRDGFRLCHRPPIQPLEMHCLFRARTAAFPSP